MDVVDRSVGEDGLPDALGLALAPAQVLLGVELQRGLLVHS